MTRAQRIAAWIALAVALVIAGHALVPQRTLTASRAQMRIGEDTWHYVALAIDKPEHVPAPFRYRVLVPLIVRTLPGAALDGLRLVTYGALALTYVLVLATCDALGLAPVPSLLGLLLIYATRTHLYHYHNPFLVDGAALLVVAAAVYALVRGWSLVYLVVLVTGVCVRESLIVLAPAWIAAGERRRAVLIALAGVAALVGVRLLMGPASDDPGIVDYVRTQAGYADHLQHPAAYALAMYRAWQIRWLLLVLGLLLIADRGAVRTLSTVTVLIVIGSTLGGIIAIDTFRLFSILMPVLVIAAGVVIAALLRTAPGVLVALLILTPLTEPLEMPEIINLPLALHVLGWLGSIVAGALTVYALRGRLAARRQDAGAS